MVSYFFFIPQLLSAKTLSHSSCYCTKFDFLMAQVFTRGMQLDKMREEAINLLYNDLETPLRNSKFPPRAYVCLEGMLCD